ncbi:MAG: ABC transporter ATP-binding protein [Clostridiales bacterium]|nr:ABC transporter ATP-binding protein [Clostridiales bacterium]MDY5514375.1 ABC transporter ATP-binding protein [Candidatus Ventricola sp.]
MNSNPSPREAFEEKAAPKRGALREFAAFYKPHLGLFTLDMLCALLIALVDILFPAVTRRVLYDYIPNQLMRTFVLVMLAMLALFLLRTAAQWFVAYLGHMMGVRIEADMRSAIFAHMQKLGFSFYDKNRTGLLMSRVTTDLFDITELAHHGPEDLFISLVTLIGSFIVVWRIQRTLALVLMIAVPLIVGFVAYRRGRMMAASRAVKQRIAGINAEIESSISGIRVAKAFCNEHEEIEKFSRCTSEYVVSRKEYYKVMAGFFSGTELMMNLMSLSVICVGSYLIMKNRMDIATLVTFNMYVASVQSPIRKLTQFTEQFTQGMAGFQRFRAIMHETPDIVDSPDAQPLDHVDGDIAFNDVTFTYDEKKDAVLEHVNLHIRPGEMLALVGPSGGGKTTLCQLIPRFYEATEGTITLDGKDIRKIRLADLRGSIGIVQQDVFLFAGSILENIRYGKPGATMEEVVEAAKLAEIHEDIMNMPEGYDTIVGERGILLSGGQKQRVSIARIFLKNPRVLILDEATSALDTATERKIQAAFDRLAKGRTTLVIAHRLSTIKNADEIVVIGEHGILERGTHRELVELGGVYAGLAAGATLAGE